VRYLAFALAFLAVRSGAAAAQQVFTVDVVNFDFIDPTSGQHIEPTIHVGDTVHWVWVSGVHSVTSVSGQPDPFNSGDHAPGFTFDHTFASPGTYVYFCDIHGIDNGNGTASGMAAKVFVVPEPSLALLGTTLVGIAVYGLRRQRALKTPISK
jgi:plastocyanin